ncbi:MAG TPA: hypothetical protein ENH55_10505 [Aurantimonas coralicida]|uniref:Uncharacterized protein n=1 Tax=marine sediment metagenome TaxID=412755 RepID=A0A0F9WUC6_9ZZZZ|nr:hypothetical protein [Aurantimonas coralicida]
MNVAVSRTQWTDDRVEALRSRVADGLGVAAIADDLATSPAAVASQMSRIRLVPAASVIVHVRNAILYRHAEGWRPSRIARQVGLDIVTVQGVIDRYATTEASAEPSEPRVRRKRSRTDKPTTAPRRPKPVVERERFLAARRAKIRKLRLQGLTLRKIGESIGASPYLVWTELRATGVEAPEKKVVKQPPHVNERERATDARRAKVRKLRANGLTLREIGERIGACESLVWADLKIMGLTTKMVVLRYPARTDERDRVVATRRAQILKLRGDGLSLREIAKRVGVSAPAVCRHLQRMKTTPQSEAVREQERSLDARRATSKRQIDATRDLNAAGLTTRQIASALGVTWDTAREYQRDLGLKINRRTAKPVEPAAQQPPIAPIAVVKAMAREGRTVEEIRIALGVSDMTIYRRLQRIGVANVKDLWLETSA